MRWTNRFNILILIVLITGCFNQETKNHSLNDCDIAFRKGDLANTIEWANSMLVNGKPDSVTILKLKSLIDFSCRIYNDFSLSGQEFENRLKQEFGELKPYDRELWERNKWIEFRVIDGQKRYFKRSVSNLKLILKSKSPLKTGSDNLDNQSLFCLEHTGRVIPLSEPSGKPVLPVKMKASYHLTVNADAVPDGETVRCWLPWPHENHKRQTKIKLLNTSPVNYYIAPDSVGQRSVYLEKIAIKGKPVTFEIQFEYESMAQYFDLRNIKKDPHIRITGNLTRYTEEQFPQIVFSDEIKHLSDSLVNGISDQDEKVRRIYYWLNDHIIWTGALEYSIIPFIPGYVLDNQRGDCGMQTLLFMSLARYQHIPVKWQSGWMMHPGAVNLHDWCEVFYDGIGWVPLDMSFNLQQSDDLRIKEFYISGIDSYRMIVNDCISGNLDPVKKFPRSEPYDFQRGEVEWKRGNLYFNQWDYHMDVQY